MTEFQNGLCTCYEDLETCAITYFCPCYTAGKNAEAMGSNCILFGCLAVTPYRIISGAAIRNKIRDKYGIEGNICTDYLMHCFCPFCALIQEHREIKAHGDTAPAGIAMARE